MPPLTSRTLTRLRITPRSPSLSGIEGSREEPNHPSPYLVGKRFSVYQWLRLTRSKKGGDTQRSVSETRGNADASVSQEAPCVEYTPGTQLPVNEMIRQWKIRRPNGPHYGNKGYGTN